jgi:hypothetical protein
MNGDFIGCVIAKPDLLDDASIQGSGTLLILAFEVVVPDFRPNMLERLDRIPFWMNRASRAWEKISSPKIDS